MIDDVLAWAEEVTCQLNDTVPGATFAKATTTNATPVAILSLPIAPNTVYAFEWTVIARQGAGSGTGEGAYYSGLVAFRDISGTATLIGSAVSLIAEEDTSAWNAQVAGSGNQAVWTVTGEASKTIIWGIDFKVRQIRG